jgi:hypothetical protein
MEFISLSHLTEDLEFADRDIGVKVAVHNSSKNVMADFAITNGTGANKVPHKVSDAIGDKQFTGRVKVKPMQDKDLVIGVGGSAFPYAEFPSDPDSSTKYAPAFEVDAEYGNFKEGPHVQAGVVFGDNWMEYDVVEDSAPSFMAVQGIATYKHPVADNKYIEAIEPLVRVSWADWNTDEDDDAGLLFTPGIQIFFAGRNKFAFNVDVFMPEHEDSDTEFSIKAQTYLHY